MATASDNIARDFAPLIEHFGSAPATAAVIIYEGVAVGLASAAGRELQAGDPFLGFADRKCDNSAGALGDKNIRLRQRGRVLLTVAGSPVQDAAVYASDGVTFTTSSASGANTPIGKVAQLAENSKYWVYFEATALRSI